MNIQSLLKIDKYKKKYIYVYTQDFLNFLNVCYFKLCSSVTQLLLYSDHSDIKDVTRNGKFSC